jgi:hypothetical protein
LTARRLQHGIVHEQGHPFLRIGALMPLGAAKFDRVTRAGDQPRAAEGGDDTIRIATQETSELYFHAAIVREGVGHRLSKRPPKISQKREFCIFRQFP